jgi:hypothetical protein
MLGTAAQVREALYLGGAGVALPAQARAQSEGFRQA